MINQMDTAIITKKTHHLGTLSTVCLSAVILPISFSGGAVATSAIGNDLGGSAAALNWITNAFMLTFGSFLMVMGTLADQFGRKKMLLLGLTGFMITSLLLIFVPQTMFLNLLRALQGIAAAAALSGGAATLAQAFSGKTHTWAFSMLGTTFGIGLAFGPILTGILIENFGWRSIFVVSASIAALALFLGHRSIQESYNPDRTQIDWLGPITFTGALSVFTFGIIQAPTNGWFSLSIIALLTCSLILIILFIYIELHLTKPMLDLSLFRYPRFIGVQILPIATCYGFVVLLVLLPLRFIGIEGYSEIHTGLLMIALSAPMLIVPTLAAALTHWFSAGTISATGLLIAAVGLFWLSQTSPIDAGYNLIVPLFLIGLGTGMPWGLMDGLSVSVVPKERAGMAAGIFNTMRVAGEAIALVIVSAILSALIQTNLQSLANDYSPESISHLAQNLAIGNTQYATIMLPTIHTDFLVQSYNIAFQYLLYILITITILSALIIFCFLHQDTKN